LLNYETSLIALELPAVILHITGGFESLNVFDQICRTLMNKVIPVKILLFIELPKPLQIILHQERKAIMSLTWENTIGCKKKLKEKSSADAKGENSVSPGFLHSLKVTSCKLLVNSEGINSSVSVQKPGRQHLMQVIKVNIIRMYPLEGWSISPVVFP
jgi:hypothetical protein